MMRPGDLALRGLGGIAVAGALVYALGTIPPAPPGSGPAQAESVKASSSKPGHVAPAAPAPVYPIPPIPALIIPVQDVQPRQLIDTYTQTRAGGARRHDAIDIMAATGTPVRAVTAGSVEALFLSREGGNTIYVRSPDRRVIYYYAHLDSYALDLVEGKDVEAGQVIGTVGFTGNANPTAPHLHFAMFVTRPEARWWEQGMPINPYPLLARR